MKLSLVVLVLTQIVAGVIAQEAEQGHRELFFAWLWGLLFPPKPTPRPTPWPTPWPTPRPTLHPTPRPTPPPTPAPGGVPQPAPPRPAPAPPSPAVAAHLKLMDAKIRATIKANPNIAATYLRLGFHDCVPNGAYGGCDGCINLASNPANSGLLPAVKALAPIVAEFENKVLGVSRADIWSYATLLGAEVSQTEILFTDSFPVGRQNCETVGTCSSKDPVFCATNGPDQETDFPDSDDTTQELLTFMFDHFGFNADQTVALMGAHSIGRALPENTGYQGQEGWDNTPLKLDNDYYKGIVGPPGALANGPDWLPMQVFPSEEWQWVAAGKGGNGKVPPFMLNVDIALVRDLGIGNKMEKGGRPLCVFNLPLVSKCPVAATLTKAGVYRENNSAWLADFKNVLIIMVRKGMK